MASISGTKTVLCVDDDSSLLRLIQISLELDGYTVITENDSVAALQLAATSPEIDAVVTDFHMPGLSGDQFCTEIRRVRPNLPILMLTASPQEIPPQVSRMVDALLSKNKGMLAVAAALKRLAA